MRTLLVTFLLLVIKTFARLFYRLEQEWVGPKPANAWQRIRVVAVLNHTSLFEVLFAGMPPNHFLWRMARHGVVPIADKTTKRPIVGLLFRLVAGNVVSISRERDHTWAKVLESIDDRDSMVVIAPEGRMKRANGLDAFGRPLVVRSGIAEILDAIPEGPFLIGYSQGLHHIQVPGQTFPRLFQPVRMRFEQLDIATYRAAMRARSDGTPEGFSRAVVDDLTRRRDSYCDGTAWGEPLPAPPSLAT